MTWAFLFDDQPWFDGFRDLATNGIDKAVLNAFRMLGKLGGDWIEASEQPRHRRSTTIMADGVRGEPDVNAVATRDDKGVSILVWHYHDDDVPGGDADDHHHGRCAGDRRQGSLALPHGRRPLQRLRACGRRWARRRT